MAGLLCSATPTLVYCGAGLSRSPSIVGAAIARHRGLSTAEGLAIVARSGPADITPGLWREVRALASGPDEPPA